MITLEPTGQIKRDGQSLNNAGDALLNNLLTAAEFQTALQAFLADAEARVTQAHDAKTLAETRLQELVTGAKTVLTLDSTQSRVAAAQALLAQVEASETERRRQTLEAEIARKEAELAALQ